MAERVDVKVSVAVEEGKSGELSLELKSRDKRDARREARLLRVPSLRKARETGLDHRAPVLLEMFNSEIVKADVDESVKQVVVLKREEAKASALVHSAERRRQDGRTRYGVTAVTLL